MGSDRAPALRVLHVVGGMNRGGVETWLMHVLRQIDRNRFHFDFLVHTEKSCAYDEEIRRLGSRILSCPHPRNPLLYAHQFRSIIRHYGPYDVVHSHVHHFSGFVLALARMCGVRKRIAHSHSDTSRVDACVRPARRLYLRVMKGLIRAHATVGLAVSEPAAAALFGPDWKRDPRWRILYYGIDLRPFGQAVDCKEVRRELGLPENALVVGHVGRFDHPKNHDFLLDVFAELVKRQSEAHLLLVGDGPLRPAMEAKAARLGLSERVHFLGVRADVPRLMMGAMDVFVFPSHFEGLPLVLLEAQAAGLPCVISDAIANESDVVPELIYRLPTSKPANYWSAIASDISLPYLIRENQFLSIVRNSPYNIDNSSSSLCNILTKTI